jgi:hypothetical protein
MLSVTLSTPWAHDGLAWLLKIASSELHSGVRLDPQRPLVVLASQVSTSSLL